MQASHPWKAAGVLPWIDRPYEEELAFKQQTLSNALRLPTPPTLHPSPRREGCRARIKLHGEGGKLGFRQEKSHRLVEGDLSVMARPEIVTAAEALRGVGGFVGEVELRSDGEKVVQAFARPVPGRYLALAPSAVANTHSKHPSGQDAFLHVEGLRVSPQSFYQVNLEVNQQILADVDGWLQELAPSRLLDLYAGVGNLSARAIRRGVPTTMIEREGAATADARHNFRGHSVEILTQDAGKLQAGSVFFDVALLDPPRAGAPGLVQKLLLTRPRALIYLSCEPTNLGRDIAPALQAGYRLASVAGYDMFPGTDHLEALVVLVR